MKNLNKENFFDKAFKKYPRAAKKLQTYVTFR